MSGSTVVLVTSGIPRVVACAGRTVATHARITRRPGPELIEAWEGYLTSVMSQLDEKSRTELEQGLLDRARDVATAAGGILGLGSKISPSEQDALDRLGKMFASAR